MVDSFFGAGQFHEIGALRRLDNCAAQAVDRGAVFGSAVLRHSSGIGTLNVHGSNLQPVNSSVSVLALSFEEDASGCFT